MRVAIRADGGSLIGMGHIMRTLVLANEISKEHQVFYVCCKDNPLTDKYTAGIEKIKAMGFEVKYIGENSILEDLKDVSADILITDSYNLNENYFNETKKMFSKTVYIDDMNLYYFNVDYLINQNINANNLDYKVNWDTKLLLGSQYSMLREEFRNVPKKTIILKPQDIMITVGGADPYNVTEKILNYINHLDYNFHVVIGPSFKNTDYIKKYESTKIKFYHNANMFELMKKCDIAISASGSTLYEFAACGVPVLAIIMAENQTKIASKMNDLGLAINLGWHMKLNRSSLVEATTNLCNDVERRKKMSETAVKVINRNGVQKIVKSIL